MKNIELTWLFGRFQFQCCFLLRDFCKKNFVEKFFKNSVDFICVLFVIETFWKIYKINCWIALVNVWNSWRNYFISFYPNLNMNSSSSFLFITIFFNPAADRFIRLIQTGPNWNNNDYLLFYHLDFFGYYIPKFIDND